METTNLSHGGSLFMEASMDSPEQSSFSNVRITTERTPFYKFLGEGLTGSVYHSV